MLLPIMRSSSRDSACSDSTASPGNSLAAKSSQTLDSFSSFRRRFAPKCLSSQQPTAQRPVGSGRESTLHWLLVAGCCIAEALRPQAAQRVEGEAGRPRGEPRDAQTRRAERTAAGQVGLRRNQREAKGTRMGRRQAAKADGGGIGREDDFKATASNPRGLDARAFTKRTGAPDECALDTS